MMEAGDPGSISAFAGLVGSRGADQLASFHLKRLLNGATGSRIGLD
jgi:adenylate cyclase